MKCTGPLFNGQAKAAAARGTTAIRAAVAAEGSRLARNALTASIRHHGDGKAERAATTTSRTRTYETGKYTMPVVVDLSETVVTTDLATYGPWLEGTGSRNLTTRFKGYQSFRKAGQVLEGMAEAIAQRTFQRYLRQMQ